MNSMSSLAGIFGAMLDRSGVGANLNRNEDVYSLDLIALAAPGSAGYDS